MCHTYWVWHNCFIAFCVDKVDIYIELARKKAMMVVSVELEDKVAVDLKQMAESLDTSEAEVVQKAVASYLRQLKMDQIRKEVSPYAKTAGFFSEEDIYKEIS